MTQRRKPRGRRPTPNTKAQIRKWLVTVAQPENLTTTTRRVS